MEGSQGGKVTAEKGLEGLTGGAEKGSPGMERRGQHLGKLKRARLQVRLCSRLRSSTSHRPGLVADFVPSPSRINQ